MRVGTGLLQASIPKTEKAVDILSTAFICAGNDRSLPWVCRRACPELVEGAPTHFGTCTIGPAERSLQMIRAGRPNLDSRHDLADGVYDSRRDALGLFRARLGLFEAAIKL